MQDYNFFDFDFLYISIVFIESILWASVAEPCKYVPKNVLVSPLIYAYFKLQA